MKIRRFFPHLINFLIWGALATALAYYTFGISSPTPTYLSIFKSSAPADSGNNGGDSAGGDFGAEFGDSQIAPAPDAESTLESLPSKIENPVPFVPQAPHKIWDQLHEEACEEAAIIAGHYYRAGQKSLTPDEAEQEIQALVAYQIENYHGHHDLTAAQMIQLAQDYYGDGASFQLLENYTLTDLKTQLALGRAIIVPAAGRVLENPYFKQPGPLYHALIISGYDDQTGQFITQDPGTKRGADFRYSYQNLMESIHDFPGEKEKILEGEKRVIVVGK